MDAKSRERLNRITTKEIHELRSDEIAFLRARKSYLNKTSKKKFAEVLVKKEHGKKTT